jgi:hypothetical protein
VSEFCVISGYVPGFAWFGELLSALSTMCVGLDKLDDTNINILE